MSLRQDILKNASLFEMALADLKGIDLESASAEEVASSYIKAAKERGMDDKKIIAGLGATFRAVGGMDSEKKVKMNADVSDVKSAVKKELGFEPKKAAPKKKKEETEEEPEETVEEPEEESVEYDILKNSGLNERKMSCKTDKMYSKNTDSYTCKYCGEKMKDASQYHKHSKMCKA